MPHPLASKLSEIRRVPAAFVTAFTKVNVAIRVLRSLSNLQGRGGITVTWSDSNVIIAGGGGGLPAGYAAEEFTICEDGAPVDVFLLVRR